jgi:hypothetical protein
MDAALSSVKTCAMRCSYAANRSDWKTSSEWATRAAGCFSSGLPRMRHQASAAEPEP